MKVLRVFGLAAVLLSQPVVAQDVSEETVYTLASAMTKLSAAVDVYVAEKAPFQSQDDEAIIISSVQHDPSLLTPFKPYLLKLRIEGRNSVVMLCTANGDRSLIEDAGCKVGVERRHYPQVMPCTFTLSPSAECRP